MSLRPSHPKKCMHGICGTATLQESYAAMKKTVDNIKKLGKAARTRRDERTSQASHQEWLGMRTHGEDLRPHDATGCPSIKARLR